jgi:type II secretory pathway pseudopilin PulG
LIGPVRGIAVLVVVSVVLAGALPAAARSPRLERLALTQLDTSSARAAVLRLGDLTGIPPGWLPLTTTLAETAPVCPWQDYSQLTITGRAKADFQPLKVGRAGFIGSEVDVFASPGDATSKLAIDGHKGTAACEGEALRKALGPGLHTARAVELSAPSVGQRALAYEFVYMQSGVGPHTIYVDQIEFVRGAAIAVLSTTTFERAGDAATRLALAHVIDGRLQ